VTAGHLGSDQGARQVLVTLRALQLVGAYDEPTLPLRRLIAQPDGVLTERLSERWPDLVTAIRSNVAPEEVAQLFQAIDATTESARRFRTFLLLAMESDGYPTAQYRRLGRLATPFAASPRITVPTTTAKLGSGAALATDQLLREMADYESNLSRALASDNPMAATYSGHLRRLRKELRKWPTS